MNGFLDEALENLFEALRIYQKMIPDSHEDIGMCESVPFMMTSSVHFSFCSAF